MKVTLASLDLFHIVNQAQYLQKAGVLDQYFCSRVRSEFDGISPEAARSCLPLHYALRVMQRWPMYVGGNHFYLQLCRLFDGWLRSQFSHDTDILAFLSGVGLQSIRAAKRHEIVTVVDCGSTHTDHQHEIVKAEYKRNGLNISLFPEGYRDRVRSEFLEADYIQLPSDFVVRTFLERGIPENKILRAAYGTNLSNFHPKVAPKSDDTFRVVCSSGVNLRKGARLLTEAWRKLGWKDAKLHWIGRPSPHTEHLFRTPLPGVVWERFRQPTELAELYRSCDVLVLPSFEEGLARVLIEGAACGLPLIATPHTGVEDFFSPNDPEGWLIPVNDVDALCEALITAKSNPDRTAALGAKAAERAKSFSWDAYGEKVFANYRQIFGKSC